MALASRPLESASCSCLAPACCPAQRCPQERHYVLHGRGKLRKSIPSTASTPLLKKSPCVSQRSAVAPAGSRVRVFRRGREEWTFPFTCACNTLFAQNAHMSFITKKIHWLKQLTLHQGISRHTCRAKNDSPELGDRSDTRRLTELHPQLRQLLTKTDKKQQCQDTIWKGGSKDQEETS